AHLPYDRPPLSKKLLSGDWEPDRIRLRKPEGFDELRLDLRLGVRAEAFDTGTRSLSLSDGSVLRPDGIILAVGSVCRRLPGQPDLPGVFELRTLDDALALRDAFDAQPSPRVVVIGAGFIGLEVAATARQRGLEVTILEGAPAPLARALGAEMGAAVAAVHGDHGVEVRCGVDVAGIEGADRATGVRLGTGELVPADVVVVGIGVRPATDWLVGSGLELRDGIVCDATLNAGVPGVYAAGDCLRWPNELFGEEMRVEHWTNAAEQGAAAAANLLAVACDETPTAYRPVPFFWSDQYTSRVQFLGRAADDDDIRIVHGSPEERRFVALFGRDGLLHGALGVSAPKLLMPYRRLLDPRVTWEDALAFAASQPV
ncbi:MAG: NAD(P)/FAD-dependent oxidoreductase, partial [Acidimicrobiia bacterium]